MSECAKYEFRQPVEVFLDGEWHKAVYDAHDPGSSFCHLVRWYAPGDKESRAADSHEGRGR